MMHGNGMYVNHKCTRMVLLEKKIKIVATLTALGFNATLDLEMHSHVGKLHSHALELIGSQWMIDDQTSTGSG